MDLKNLLVLCAFIVNLSLSILVHLRSVKTKANIAFEITAFGITAWCLTMIFYRVADAQYSIVWAKLLYFFPAFIPTGFLIFGLLFPKHKIKGIIIAAIIVFNVIIAILTLSGDSVIKNVLLNPSLEKKIIFGWAYYRLYIFYIPGFFIASYVVLFRKYLKGGPLVKMQILYILLGLTTASVPAMITNLNLPTFGYFELNWVGQLFTVFWISGVAYAIMKHRLMDVRLVVARSVAYVFLIAIIAAFYTSAVFIAGSLFLTGKTSVNQTILYVLLTIFVAFTFQPVRYFLEKVTEKIFFKNNYNSNELLSRLTKILATNLKLENISTKTLNELFATMHVSKGTFYVVNDREIMHLASGGFDGEKIHDRKLILELCKKKKIIIFDEEISEKTKDAMRKLGVSILLPLYAREKLIGALSLGEKRSGDIYFDKDIEVLKIFGPEVSVALENSKSYEEISRFNITLKEEVSRATKDLKNANVRLKEVDELKDEFVSLASHELRTPMTIIKSYLWLMLDKKNSQSLSESQKKYLDRAYVSTERLINLVNDMLNVSRIESGRFTVSIKPFDIEELISTVYAEILPKAQEQKINLEFARPLHPLPKVQADSERVEQVLINLIGNSLKFTSENGSIRISAEYDSDRKQEVISITDDGKGIAAEDIPKLFQKFSMVGNNYLVKQNIQGTGLGLYLSKAIIELMGGKIWVESAGLDKGSKFSFALKTA